MNEASAYSGKTAYSLVMSYHARRENAQEEDHTGDGRQENDMKTRVCVMHGDQGLQEVSLVPSHRLFHGLGSQGLSPDRKSHYSRP